jgi:polysaccharide biosynthesis/export protein
LKRSGAVVGLATLLLTFAPPLALISAARSVAADDLYRLAPGDRFTVTVFGQPELSGEVQVDDSENIHLPLVGTVHVGGSTIAQTETTIQLRYADGYLVKPSVSIRATDLRPIYVLGDVRHPGAYPFRFGMTAKAAVALAGGFGNGDLLPTTVAGELISADEQLKRLNLQRATLLVREARLIAQRDGKETFSAPPAPTQIKKSEMDAIVDDETKAMEAQDAALHAEVVLLEGQRPQLQAEIAALNSELSISKQKQNILKEEATQYQNLFNKGLSTRATLAKARFSVANEENETWNLTAQLSQLQVNLGDLELKINKAKTVFKDDNIKELLHTQEKLKELDIEVPSAIAQRELRLRNSNAVQDEQVVFVISISRQREAKTNLISFAPDTAPMQPGDVVEVHVQRPYERQNDDAHLAADAQ